MGITEGSCRVKCTVSNLEDLRSQIVGVDASFPTPFGERLMVYCDYTASGRCLSFVEQYLQSLQRIYANTHTEDDITGRSMTRLLHEAEHIIKNSVNAGPHGRIIACGTGATGAIDKLQQLLGITLAPATKGAIRDDLTAFLGTEKLAEFDRYQQAHQPVVFVGPYEHHSNEISWRHGRATVVQVRLTNDGAVDLAHLETLLQDPRYQNKVRIGSFSAASNVTGMRTPVHAIAGIMHRHGGIACFDYAACAPYVDIDMNPPRGPNGEDQSLDAIFISPHKFLGGPGSSGVLVFNERLYHRDLPPTVAAGGTVDYVSPIDQDFIPVIEEREKPGTPGVLQTIKAALAFLVKDGVGADTIEARDTAWLQRALDRWQQSGNIVILGNPNPQRRISIVSFNIRTPCGKYLHPKFVTALLNDMFGIQSRAGCSCAGPYGHRLLDIDYERSECYRQWIAKGYSGIKPGWCRVGFHYVMDQAEVDYVIDAVEFVARHGYLFLGLYDFDLLTGAWTHREPRELDEQLSLEAALRPAAATPALSAQQRSALYQQYLDAAGQWADKLRSGPIPATATLHGELGDLQFFSLPAEQCAKASVLSA